MQDEKNLENQEVEETSAVSVPSEEATDKHEETVDVSAPSPGFRAKRRKSCR